MALDIFLIALSAICLTVGLIGCILPMLPGPPVSYIGLLLLHFTDKVEFTAAELLVWLAIVVVIQLLDYFTPLFGTKVFGGSKYGNWGCIAGTIAGIFFMPWGIIAGPLLGAVAGELIAGRPFGTALKSGIGAFIGFLTGTLLKLAVAAYFIFCFFTALLG